MQIAARKDILATKKPQLHNITQFCLLLPVISHVTLLLLFIADEIIYRPVDINDIDSKIMLAWKLISNT